MTGPHEFDEFNPNNPYTAIALLGERVKNLGIEKEALERREDALEQRIAKLEASYGKGAGILIGLGTVGTIGGILLAYGKAIFAPWAGK